ncbi:MAG: hypothetical protein O2840_03070 [bacterium]|nr:hypothetical protein [bacterium]
MAIKLQSQKFLLTLFPDDNQTTGIVAQEVVARFFPQLSSGRFRSLAVYLESKGLLRYERAGHITQLYLAETGKKELYALFPAIDPSRQNWAGNWSCLVFQESPSGDKAFRYLRRKLVELNAIQLTRGVYLYPDTFPALFIEQCSRLYRGAVLILAVASLQFGELRPIVLEKGNITAVLELYSGISKEIRQLLAQIENTSSLNDQQKALFVSLFDRFVAILKEDTGLGRYFFPEETWGREVLQLFRSIVLL